MWLFGRIADGSEDGVAVDFGTAGGTNQRGARVFGTPRDESGGTIFQLVGGFSWLSHATDPQMPTVTTPNVEAIASAFIVQNDNNTMGASTGESGGDWLENTSEYVAALTPGFMIGTQYAWPGASGYGSGPGTMSGGSIATTNDPCGVLGFWISPIVTQPKRTMHQARLRRVS